MFDITNCYQVELTQLLALTRFPFSQGKTSVSAYFPRASWYDLDSGHLLEGVGSSITLDAPLSKINVHVKGGVVMGFQKPEVTTTLRYTSQQLRLIDSKLHDINGQYDRYRNLFL